MKKYFLSIDQGTTSTRTVLYDSKFKYLDQKQIEIMQFYPKSGYVEHDAEEIWEKTYKTGESLEKADLENIPMQFLYESGEEVVMMNNNSFDQETFLKGDLGDSIQWMEEGESYEVLLFEGSPLSVELDTFVEMEVTETEPGFKGDTATGATKPAILKNGVEVKVPLFIEIGDILKIDTRTGEYQSRAKD